MAGGIQAKVSVPKKAVDLYERGLGAAEKNNYDYAITLFLEALKQAPTFIVARTKLRETEMQKWENGKSPAILRKMGGALLSIPYWLAAFWNESFGNMNAALRAYEGVLKRDPTNSGALKGHAKAALKLDMPEVAVNSMEYVYKASPNSDATQRLMGEMYRANGQIEEAKVAWQKVLSTKPSDKDALHALHDLAALATISKGKWEDTSSFRSSLKDEAEAKLTEKRLRVEKTEDDRTALIEDYKRRIAAEPEKVDLVKRLANEFLEAHRYDEAVEAFNNAIDLNPGDPDLPELRYRVLVKKHDHLIEQAEDAARANPGDAALKQQVEERRRDKTRFMLEDLAARVHKYPSNMPLRFEYGYALMLDGQTDEAIKQFQQSKNNAQKQAMSLNYLGECFRQKGLLDLAVDQFKTALGTMHMMDSVKKDVIYNLARTYEDMGKAEESLKHYKVIYAEDIGFRDIAERVEKLYKAVKQGGGE
ncbi:MAG: tetratricopeptide repeat protein [Verrucomicrobia bacterium]|nr:tetratricopeptide repeat protein [Verrucomicrobiota bacterium]